jgi:xanthine/uracil/vitamin C permease (AzgA family)
MSERTSLLNGNETKYATALDSNQPRTSTFEQKLDSFFKVTERESTLQTEFIAGGVNFVANAYLLVLVPQINQNGGVDFEVSMIGFALSTFFASVAVGLLCNLPTPVGPCLGSATYFAYSLSKMHPQADTSESPNTNYILTVCFVAGIVMTALALLGLPMTGVCVCVCVRGACVCVYVCVV